MLFNYHAVRPVNPTTFGHQRASSQHLSRKLSASISIESLQPARQGLLVIRVDHTLGQPTDRRQQRIWDYVSRSPLRSLWNLQGIPIRVVAKRTWKSLLADNLLGRAAELGFYFLFALFPTLFSASSILGLAARSASTIYYKLLHYLALVIPTSALGTVLDTFNETTAAASSGKLTFGLIAAIWSASVGISAIQEALNTVYKVRETRSYFRARLSAIGVTIVLSGIITLTWPPCSAET